MEFHAFLRSRRSIRRFKIDAVSDKILRRLIETATCAPSAHDMQPWRFIVLRDPEIKKRLAYAIAEKFREDSRADGVTEADIDIQIERTNRRINDAPVIIVLCRDTMKVKSQPDEIRRQAEVRMAEQSVALAGLQLLLAAHAEGLGGTWICWPLFAPEATSLALDLPANWAPQGMIFLGYPDETPSISTRIPFEEVARIL